MIDPKIVLEEYYKTYHNPLLEKKPFNYEKLKDAEKLNEDVIRTAFFSGFRACEDIFRGMKKC